MKKIFTLLAAAFATCFLAEAQQPVTMTWNLSSKTDLNATVTGEGAEFVTTSDISLAKDFSISSARTTNSVKGLAFKKSSAYPTDADTKSSDNYVQFPYTIANGKEFVVSRVSYYIGKRGTDGELFANVFMYENSTNKLTIKNKVILIRETKGYYAYEDHSDFTDWNALTGSNSLTFNLYTSTTGNFNPSKEFWMSTIVIEGFIQDSGFVDEREEVDLAWDPANVTLKVRDPFTAPVLTKSVDVPVTFESSNTAVATVDENGVVSLVEGVTVAAGQTAEAIITASFAGNDEYKAASATCKITLTSNVTENNYPLSYITHDLLSTVIYTTPDYVKGSSETLPVGNVYLDDDALKVTMPFAAKLVDSYKVNMLGYEFNSIAQVRSKSAPSNDNLEGVDNGGSSTLVIEAKKDVTVVFYYRRQSVEDDKALVTTDDVENNSIVIDHYWGCKPNDGKAFFLADQANIGKKLDNEIVFGVWQDANKQGFQYMFVASVYKLEAGHTYTAWGQGTTIGLYAIGYGPKMTNPWHFNSVEGYQYNLGDIVELGHVEGPQYIYYTLDEAEPNPANVEVAPAAAPARLPNAIDEDHTGKTYNLAQRPIVYNGGDLNIKFLAHKDGYTPSDVQELSIADGGQTTGIENVAVDSQNAPVEFFNLQGVRVDNPSNGIFIRRQGKNVSKVVVK